MISNMSLSCLVRNFFQCSSTVLLQLVKVLGLAEQAGGLGRRHASFNASSLPLGSKQQVAMSRLVHSP